MAENGTFEIIDRDGLARIGKFQTPHGMIETPGVMPVVNPNIIVLSANEMKKLGMQALITNSYIIKRTPDLAERALREGVHVLVGFDGPIMTDSGTFQSYVYGGIEYSNVDMLDFQKRIGSDICTILDIFSTPDDGFSRAKYAVEETHKRAKELPDDGTIYAGTIQGSVYPSLRRRSARIMSSSNVKYLPIGGVVPMLESYAYADLVSAMHSAKMNADFSKPVHLFGGGHPMFLALSVLTGVDMFDSASYIKYARDDRVLMQDRTLDLSDVEKMPAWSPLADMYTISELRSLEREEKTKALATHNLFAIFAEIAEIKQRIAEQSLRRYVKEKARSHPYLMDAYKKFLGYRDVSAFESYSRKAPFYYTDAEDSRDPIYWRLRNFCIKEIARSDKQILIVDDALVSPVLSMESGLVRAYENSTAVFVRNWNGIPVPIELWDTYPVQQSILSRSAAKRNIQALLSRLFPRREIIEFDDPAKLSNAEGKRRFDLEKIRMIARYQFSTANSSLIFPDSCSIRTSRKTDRIRTVSYGDDLIATLRASDGFLTFTTAGAKLLEKALPGMKCRVMVSDESRDFNLQGKNVFFKFIIDSDREIVPGNDTLVVDRTGNMIAIGKSTVSGREISYFRRGVAVDVRSGIGQPGD
ncbi:MAG: tRNA guanosine(15) transglycosylase TgtA [Candidatus Thermoplasmatota archaeon]|nr:tRNA guanosine(15) transglycosylase TgtA [Candidatus Thermoplasmatota archaeon]